MATKKSKPTIWTHYMGLRQRYSPAVEEKIRQNERGATSPLGGKAVKAVPLVAKGKPR